MNDNAVQVAVGFGVSRPEHAKQLRAWGADGVIVGSALVKCLGEAATPVGDQLPRRSLSLLLACLLVVTQVVLTHWLPSAAVRGRASTLSSAWISMVVF